MNSTTAIQSNSDNPRPWYREKYVWLVILFPFMSICMGITIIVLSVKSYDGLVVDDYYKRGMAINEILARDERADQLSLSATLNWRSQAKTLAVKLSADNGFNYPDTVQVKLMHATRGGMDQSITMDHAGNGRYLAKVKPLAPGHWHVEIAARDWRLMESIWQTM